jgi:hypothetical protein
MTENTAFAQISDNYYLKLVHVIQTFDSQPTTFPTAPIVQLSFFL